MSSVEGPTNSSKNKLNNEIILIFHSYPNACLLLFVVLDVCHVTHNVCFSFGLGKLEKDTNFIVNFGLWHGQRWYINVAHSLGKKSMMIPIKIVLFYQLFHIKCSLHNFSFVIPCEPLAPIPFGFLFFYYAISNYK